MRRALFSLLAALAGVGTLGARPWLIVNEDNDHFFKSDASLMTRNGLEDYLDYVCRGPVTHFFMCPEGQRASFGSKTWEPIWKGIDEPDHCGVVSNRWCVNAKLLHDHGIDPYAVWIARCRFKGVSPWLSMRMNDVHHSNLTNYFRSTTFCRTRRDLWIRPDGPPDDWTNACLDYAKQGVREYALAHIREIVGRWDVDGLELDWMRFGRNLRPGHEREDAHHLDGFMREVRGILDRTGGARGRRIALSVRVCRDPDLTRDCMGMDVAKWAREGLVDLVVPHSFYMTDAGIAVAKWSACMKEANPRVRVIPGIDYRIRTGGKGQWMTLELYRGVAEKFYREGAEGLYLFNLPYLGKYHTDGMLVKEDVAETIYSEGLSPEVIQTRPRQTPDVNHDFP